METKFPNRIGGNPTKIYIIGDDAVDAVIHMMNKLIYLVQDNCDRTACRCNEGMSTHADYYRNILDIFKKGLKEPKLTSEKLLELRRLLVESD